VYEGIAKIDFKDKVYNVPVSVSAELHNILVQTKLGGFIFFFEKEMNNVKEKFDDDMKESTKDLEQKLEATTLRKPIRL